MGEPVLEREPEVADVDAGAGAGLEHGLVAHAVGVGAVLADHDAVVACGLLVVHA